MENLAGAWEQLLEQLSSSFHPSTIESILKRMQIEDGDDGQVRLLFPNHFSFNLVSEEQKELLGNGFARNLDIEPSQIHFGVSEDGLEPVHGSSPVPTAPTAPPVAVAEAPEPPRIHGQTPRKPRLRADFSFESFVPGDGNLEALAAAKKVAGNPGSAYNPLFIYGSVGLGKTHLLQAIGWLAGRLFPNLTIKYCTIEEFTSRFIGAIQGGTMPRFRDDFRSLDLLLIDDVQFLSKKTETQEELFHTFNYLNLSGGQIVFTSDRSPYEFDTKDIQIRLISRFGSGLVCDILPPEFETRRAILESKAARLHLTVPGEILELIATKIQNNVRNLESSLLRFKNFTETYGRNPALAEMEDLIKDLLGFSARPKVGVEQIKSIVATHYGLSPDDLEGSSRKKNLVYPRMLAMYFARKNTKLSLSEIGQSFGGQDHSTVIHANNKIIDLIESDPHVQRDVVNIEKILG